MKFSATLSYKWVDTYCPTQHIIGDFEDNFYRSEDPTNSIKAMRKPVGHWDRLQSHKPRSLGRKDLLHSLPYHHQKFRTYHKQYTYNSIINCLQSAHDTNNIQSVHTSAHESTRFCQISAKTFVHHFYICPVNIWLSSRYILLNIGDTRDTTPKFLVGPMLQFNA